MGCVLCKRFMLRIAEQIAQKEKAKAIVTGDNLGQVASQTLDNLAIVSEAAGILILRPLLCFDKEDIIKKAKEIGSYEISILPSEMYCFSVLPKHPATKAQLVEVKKEEAKINLEASVDKTIKDVKVLNL